LFCSCKLGSGENKDIDELNYYHVRINRLSDYQNERAYFMYSLSQIKNNYYKTLQKIVVDSISPFLTGNTIIYGTGFFGRSLYIALKDFGFEDKIVAFTSSFAKDADELIEGKTVLCLETVNNRFPDAKYLLASMFAEPILDYIKSKEEFKNIEFINFSHYMTTVRLANYFNSVHSPQPDEIAIRALWFDKAFDLIKSCQFEKQISSLREIMVDDRSLEILKDIENLYVTGDPTNLVYHIDTPMYFSNDYLPFTDNEVFFDIGAFTGDTINSFIRFTSGNIKQCVAFEPDKKNIAHLEKMIADEHFNNVSLVKAGAGEKKCTLQFESSLGACSRIKNKVEDSSLESIDIVPLDDYFDLKPTFIKMDIEGAELGAIKGAEKIIRNLKPKLAISIYHRFNDIFEIPFYLKELCPEYKFKIRSHDEMFTDIVLYAYT